MIIKNITLCSSITRHYVSDFHTSDATRQGVGWRVPQYKRGLVVA